MNLGIHSHHPKGWEGGVPSPLLLLALSRSEQGDPPLHSSSRGPDPGGEGQSLYLSFQGSWDRKEGGGSTLPRGPDTGRGYQVTPSRLPGVPGPEEVVSSQPATSQVLTSGGRYGGLLALLPLFFPFFFFPFGPPQPLLPPAPLALRVPPMAGPPPGRQQPPNSSDTRESIRRRRQPPARPLPPATTAAAAPTATAASGQPEESGVGPCPGHAPTRLRLQARQKQPRGTTGYRVLKPESFLQRGRRRPTTPRKHRGARGRRWLWGVDQERAFARKGPREL